MINTIFDFRHEQNIGLMKCTVDTIKKQSFEIPDQVQQLLALKNMHHDSEQADPKSTLEQMTRLIEEALRMLHAIKQHTIAGLTLFENKAGNFDDTDVEKLISSLYEIGQLVLSYHKLIKVIIIPVMVQAF